MAIRRCVGHVLGAEQSLSTRLVLDDHRLAQARLKKITKEASHHVGRPARPRRDNNAYRLLGIVFCAYCVRCKQQRRQRHHQNSSPDHGSILSSGFLRSLSRMPMESPCNGGTVGLVPIADQGSAESHSRECFRKLACMPFRGWVCGDSSRSKGSSS